MAMAFSECPLAEFMMMSEQADKIEPNFGEIRDPDLHSALVLCPVYGV